MSVFKCKMCGGALEINENQTVAVCEYCGTQQTLPKLTDDKRANLYDRANHFRRNNEFDKAIGIYEQILNEDGTDAEAYWSLVLCRYGIEYVDDPASRKRVPTVNRTQFTSIFDDDNYKSALQYADASQKAIYEEEANAINEIQKGILAISQEEEPFDVFICYKETDNNGRRTQDSVLANDLYHQLTQEGFKVFFSRITLEDKLGTAYEPYIFAALNSAKVMVVIGTKPEFFNAVWVKNEWSRYLALIKNGAKKILIPAYRDMDPYDLPEEFSHLQAQDMSKLGFMQDLIRGIKKITEANTEKVTIKESIISNGTNVTAIIDRAFLLIEDGDTEKADECLEEAITLDPKNPLIYVAKLLIEQEVNTQDALATCSDTFEDSANYQKAVRFASNELKATLEGYNASILARNTENTYNEAVRIMNSAMLESDFLEAKDLFASLSDYKDSADKSKECAEKAAVAKKEQIYKDAVKLLEKSDYSFGQEINNAKKAIASFEKIKDYKDSGEQIVAANHKIAELEQKIVVRKKKNKKIAIVLSSIAAVAVVVIVLLTTVILPTIKYNDAMDCLAAEQYDDAYALLTELGDFKDTEEQMAKSRYTRAEALFAEGKLEDAFELYDLAGSYTDAKDKANECQYQRAVALRNEKKWDEANAIFEEIKDYKDSKDLLHYHSWDLTNEKKATCTASGSKTYTCPGCKETKTETLNSLGHSYSFATCTAPKKCSRCGKTEGSALGHTSGGTTCSRCGANTFKPITYSGTGFKTITNIVVPEGNFVIKYKATVSSRDNNKFYFDLYYANGNKAAYECSHAYPDEPVTSQQTFEGAINNGKLVVDAESNVRWTFTIEAF